MPSSHQYHRPPDADSESEDDLNLDELDPIANGSLPRNTGLRSKGRSNQADGIPLNSLRNATTRRLWSPSSRDQLNGRAGQGSRGLLHGRFDAEDQYELEDNGDLSWNVRGASRGAGDVDPPTSQRVRPSTSRTSTIRRSLQLTELVRQELADMREEATPDNNDSREVLVGQRQPTRFPANVVSNAKYTAWSFLPRTLYNEFSFFLNIYFLLVALSQIIKYLRIGYMSTYIVPLACVLTISIGKEAVDDIARRRRDAEANAELYTVLTPSNTHQPRSSTTLTRPDLAVQKKSRDIKVGDILKLSRNQRLPADVVILQSNPAELTSQKPDLVGETDGSQAATETFIRTDQLDGETDWKLRLPAQLGQGLRISDLTRLKVRCGAPDKNVNEFVGTLELSPEAAAYDPHILREEGSRGSQELGLEDGAPERTPESVPLSIENTAWANTVLASNSSTLAVVIYTGRQTRSALSTAPSRSKIGLLEYEINNLTKILCVMTLTLSIVLVALEGFQPSNQKPWYVAILIYLILFSTIIPISLRVNLDMGKTVYAYFIERDRGIPDTVVRTSTIPEDLGRIEYLLSDKTGTLTQNEMQLRKIHVGTVSYANEAMEEVSSYVGQAFGKAHGKAEANGDTSQSLGGSTRTRREIGSRVRDLVLALALCHNVTPTFEEIDGQKTVTYQASSPDEIAIVEFAETVGLCLAQRDREKIVLQSSHSDRTILKAEILELFPFTSDSKRMGIILRVNFEQDFDLPDKEIWFFQKGADTVMSSIVSSNDWLDEETSNMAREGLRTLVIGRKHLSSSQYEEFHNEYQQASLTLQDRDSEMANVIKKHLEHDLELLGVTGVEDRLQQDVKPSLELLRNAGIKIWMLTGDKLETARCVAVSSRLVARGQPVQIMTQLRQKARALDALDSMRNKTDSCLLIDGESLSTMLANFQHQFIALAVLLPAVIACRCSPTQKADLAKLIRKHTKKRICCIGDGGNDVSMIQAADVGIGIVGKEGRQASLAADFSITQFCHLTKLLVWHGRNSYKRSAKLAQFIIHRGLIISVCQTMYSIAGRFDPKGLFKDWLLVGYATVYTMAPVFSLVLDRDVDEKLANLYPELYKELKTGQSLSYKTFFTWVLVSVYQGIIIQGLSQLLVGAVDGPRMLSVSFTVLIFNELIMVAVAVTTWHPIMIICILGTGALYAASIPFLGEYFDLSYIVSWGWVWRVAAVAAISLTPVWGGKIIRRAWKPPTYRKVRESGT